MRESFVFIVGKPVDESSDVAMSLHDSLSRMACNARGVFDQNDGSESAADGSGAKLEEKERCALYYLCFSCSWLFASSRRTRNRDMQKSSVWEV